MDAELDGLRTLIATMHSGLARTPDEPDPNLVIDDDEESEIPQSIIRKIELRNMENLSLIDKLCSDKDIENS